MLKGLTSFAVAASLALGARAWADSPVVVELFTSQGCSSCPPADKMLQTLAKRDDVIALALHVDYWDYIGWKDVFAQHKFSTRQRQYAKHGGRRSVYTPQMIINGTTDVVGAMPMKVSQAIAEQAARPSAVDIQLRQSGNTLTIQGESQAEAGPFLVQMIRYTPQAETRITRGENAGKILAYTNIVREWDVIAEWDGKRALSLSVPFEEGDPVVVIIQKEKFGPIMAAARLP